MLTTQGMKQPREQNRGGMPGRIVGIDCLKGFLICCMTILHGGFFFQSHLESIPLGPLNPLKLAGLYDPFVFTSYMVCYGLGYAFSKNLNQGTRMQKLVMIYFLGGVVSAYGVGAVEQFRTGLPPHFDWFRALTLRHTFPYAGYVLPFICVSVIYFVFESALVPNAKHRIAVMAILSAVGIGVDAGNRHFNLLPAFLGFPCYGALLLFFVGLELGRKWRQTSTLPLQGRGQWGFAVGGLGITLAATRILYPSNLHTFPWKMSGSWTYIPFGIVAAFFSLTLVQSIPASKLGAIGNALVWLGKHATESLLYTMTAVPLAGLVALRLPSERWRDGWFVLFLTVSALLAIALCRRSDRVGNT
jgi:hypothetical protein